VGLPAKIRRRRMAGRAANCRLPRRKSTVAAVASESNRKNTLTTTNQSAMRKSLTMLATS
jgi:hypothetical protein